MNAIALTPEQEAVIAALPRLLVPWYEKNMRVLPWRADTDPYKVWVAEIMLQQTRAEAARGYFERFVARLPDAYALADCPDDLLMKLWEGLGYYSRARNLKAAARIIVGERGGVFPSTRAELEKLPGVGSYTAGAIASIAFGLPEAAVDGNVLRVTARAGAFAYPVSDPNWRKRLTELLSAVYPPECGAFTQSFMDLGSAVCLPVSPRCEACPLAEICIARKTGATAAFPVRLTKKPRRAERLTVFALTYAGKTAVNKRPETGLLAGLWELPNAPGRLDRDEALAWLADRGLTPDGAFIRTSAKHLFTHIEWDMLVYAAECKTPSPAFVWADIDDPNGGYALPSAFRRCIPHQSPT